jgi:hypothetical protein
MKILALLLLIPLICSTANGEPSIVSASTFFSSKDNAPYTTLELTIKNSSDKKIVVPTAISGLSVFARGRLAELYLLVSANDYYINGVVTHCTRSSLAPITLGKGESTILTVGFLWPSDAGGDFILKTTFESDKKLEDKFGIWAGKITFQCKVHVENWRSKRKGE